MIAGATRHSEKLGLRRIRATLGRGEALGDYGNGPPRKAPFVRSRHTASTATRLHFIFHSVKSAVIKKETFHVRRYVHEG